MADDTLANLTRRLRTFAAERDWEQFHSPKNLSMALIAEAGELVEHFQWLTQEQSRTVAAEKRDAIEMELADILIYLVRLADRLGLDLCVAAEKKMDINERKYPRHRVKGSARKYNEY